MNGHEHRVHSSSYYRGPQRPDGWNVWCTAGDLELRDLDEAEAKHRAAEHAQAVA